MYHSLLEIVNIDFNLSKLNTYLILYHILVFLVYPNDSQKSFELNPKLNCLVLTNRFTIVFLKSRT